MGDAALAQDKKESKFSGVVVKLMKGVVFRDRHEAIWRDLEKEERAVEGYLAKINLQVNIDREEGYAYLSQIELEDETVTGLIARRSLTYPVSLLCVILREYLSKSENEAKGSRIMISRQQIHEMMLIFLPGKKNEAKTIDKINGYIVKVLGLGFLRPLQQSKDLSGQASNKLSEQFEIVRIIKAFVDANWLHDMATTLKKYKKYGSEKND